MSGPAPIITIEVNEEALERVCDTLKIPVDRTPMVVIKKQKGHTKSGMPWLGLYDSVTNTVTISLGHECYETDKLRYVKTELIVTLLHELRHAWQHFCGPKSLWDNTVARENDAETWAVKHVASFRDILTVRRKFHGSGMSRLNAAERKARD